MSGTLYAIGEEIKGKKGSRWSMVDGKSKESMVDGRWQDGVDGRRSMVDGKNKESMVDSRWSMAKAN
jgi:hypothetical protein